MRTRRLVMPFALMGATLVVAGWEVIPNSAPPQNQLARVEAPLGLPSKAEAGLPATAHEAAGTVDALEQTALRAPNTPKGWPAVSLEIGDALSAPQALPPRFTVKAQSPDNGDVAESDWTEITLASGDTLDGVLRRRAELTAAESLRVTRVLAQGVDPQTLRPGTEIQFSLRAQSGQAGRLRALRVRSGRDEWITVERSADGELDMRTESVSHEREFMSARLNIQGSLYGSAVEAEVPDSVLSQAYRQLSHRIDFQREVRRGDRIAMVFERFQHPGDESTHAGRLLAVRYAQRDSKYTIYRFDPGDGPPGYFDADGVSVETTLSRTPVRDGRVSSRFGRRDHPVLGYTRMHKGLDFAAPRGAAILAAGDGEIVRAGPNGSFGNYIRIRHDAELSTAYAHLSRFASGMTEGRRVEQGEVIGYVGATGLATGPNLHYEVLRNGTQVDPRSLDLPPSRTLTGAALEDFRRVRASLSAGLSQGADSALVRLEPEADAYHDE